MGLFLVGSGNSPLQPIADFLYSTFREDVSISYAPQLAIVQLQDPDFTAPSVMIADISGQTLPEAAGFLHAVQFAFPDLPVVAMTSPEQMEHPDILLQAGCMDMLLKPTPRARLRIAVVNAIRMRGLRLEVHRMRLRQEPENALGLAQMETRNPAMQLALVLARKAAKQETPCWLQGEHGAGKETLARAMLAESARERPFVSVGCATQPENILERQLFGGASRRVQGAVEKAEGGMLYLDEIERMPSRFLPMLAEAMGRPNRPWIIVSTRMEAVDLVARTDLHHLLSERWKLSPLRLPPLHLRKEDIPTLAENQLARFARMEGIVQPALSSEASAWLLAQRWPGNLPEFSRCLHRALWQLETDTLEVAHLESGRTPPVRQARMSESWPSGGFLPVLDTEGKIRPLAELEEEMLQFALKHHEGCMARAARDLGIGRSTLYRKLQERTVDSAA